MRAGPACPNDAAPIAIAEGGHIPYLTFGDHAQETLRERHLKMAEREARVEADPSPDHVHQLRVACRRLGSAISACRAAVELPDEINPEHLVRLAKVLGRLRDLHVQDAVLTDELAPALGTDGEAFLQRAGVETRRLRDRAEAKAGRALNRHRHRRFVAALDRWMARPRLTRLASLPLDAVRADILLPTLAELLLHRAWPVPLIDAVGASAGALHDLRKTARRMRYVGECFEASYGPEFAAWLGELARLQDALGQLHDSQRLQESLSAAATTGLPPRLFELIRTRESPALSTWTEIRDRYLDSRWRADLRGLVLGRPSGVTESSDASTG